RVAHANRDALADAGTIEVAAGLFGAFGVAVGVDDASAFAHRARPPDGGIAYGRAHFEELLRAADGGQLIKHASDGGADDGHIVFAGVSFHLGENFVARRQHRVQVVFDL